MRGVIDYMHSEHYYGNQTYLLPVYMVTIFPTPCYLICTTPRPSNHMSHPFEIITIFSTVTYFPPFYIFLRDFFACIFIGGRFLKETSFWKLQAFLHWHGSHISYPLTRYPYFLPVNRVNIFLISLHVNNITQLLTR